MSDIFYFTDIHGMKDLFDAIMEYCNEQDKDAMIIFGGDACDRGREGYYIMKQLLDNPHVVYLKGNHEDMFVQAARQVKEMFSFKEPVRKNVVKILRSTLMFDGKYRPIQQYLINQGMNTLVDWIMDGMPMDFVDKIDNLPLTISVDGKDFCHAGATFEIFDVAKEAEYNDYVISDYFCECLLWDRRHLNNLWAPGRICIFGHTPVPHLPEFIDAKWPKDKQVEPWKYNSGKLCMDTGCAFTGRAFVLNVLTMKAQGFEDTEFENNEIRKHDVKKIDCIQF